MTAPAPAGVAALPGADGPHRFVGDDQSGYLLGGEACQAAAHLSADHLLGLAGIVLGLGLAHADDGHQTRGPGRP